MKEISAGIYCNMPSVLVVLSQLGEMFYEDRQAWLRERYCFTCTCSACKHITHSDLLLIALHCSKASCEGVVPGPAVSPATESEAFQV
jgi:hypothetical protein